MNRRDEQIAAIVRSTEGLDADRLAAFYALVRDAYEQASIVGHVAVIDEISDRSPSDFRVLTNQELRPIEHFNGPEYHWDMYCRELGRSVALGEEAYLFEVLQALIPDTAVIPGQGFEGLLAELDHLASQGTNPDIVLAPIAFMRGFLRGHDRSMEWDQHGRTYWRAPDGRRLELFWSSRGRPLDRFIVFDHAAGVWHVKTDSSRGGRLTVAIGEQHTPMPGVMWLAETVAKYEVINPRGFRSFRPDVRPDPGFDLVR